MNISARGRFDSLVIIKTSDLEGFNFDQPIADFHGCAISTWAHINTHANLDA